MIRVFFKIVKTEGVFSAAKKTFHYIIASTKKKIQKAPIFFYYWKLKILESAAVRFKERTIKILGFHIHYCDLRSLYMEFKDIFKNGIYYFQANNDAPKIIDGGGFIGISVLYFKYLYPKSSIIVFEPSPSAFTYLKKNIHENNVSGVTLVEKGLSGENAEMRFEESGRDAGKISTEGLKKISATQLSSYINSSLDFLKLNIEGAELAVLRDLDKNDSLRYIKELCLEWHSFKEESQNLDEILAILKKNNFKYLINHFDYITNRAVRPPFRLDHKTQYYLLVYAKKINSVDKK